MSDRFVFLSYRAEIPWIVRLARALSERGVASELWVVDAEDRAAGEASGVFGAVVDLRGGFSRRGPGGSDAATVRRAARELEDQLGGERFLHREASVDRVLTGRSHIELPPLRATHRWAWEDVCRLSVAVASTVRERLRERPIAVVAEPSMFAGRLVARVVQAEGVRFLSPMGLPYLPGRLQFMDGVTGQWQRCVDRFHALEGGEIPTEAAAVARETIERIRRGSTHPNRRETVANYLATPRDRLSPRRVTGLASDWRAARAPEALSSPHNPFPELLSPWARLARKARRRVVLEGFERSSIRELPDAPFAAYLVHVQPEMTVDGWAFEHYDQVATIRNIAATLPADMLLVVKEHPVLAGLRDPSFYKELSAMPGVVVVHDGLPSSETVRRAEIVFTLTGTVALEAMCVGVPVVLLGSVYYEHFPGVARARSLDELRALVDGRGSWTFATEEECERVMAARQLASLPGGWLSGGRTVADEHVTAASLLEEAAT